MPHWWAGRAKAWTPNWAARCPRFSVSPRDWQVRLPIPRLALAPSPPPPLKFWRLGEALRAQRCAEVHFRHLGEILGTVFGDEFFGGGVNCGRGTLRKHHLE